VNGLQSSLIKCKAVSLPVTGAGKRAKIANEGGTTVTRPFYEGLEWLFFLEKLA